MMNTKLRRVMHDRITDQVEIKTPSGSHNISFRYCIYDLIYAIY